MHVAGVEAEGNLPTGAIQNSCPLSHGPSPASAHSFRSN
jgi:hypothetical protein